MSMGLRRGEGRGREGGGGRKSGSEIWDCRDLGRVEGVRW